MRLEPVFVVAPKAASPSMSTRRAFLLASGTFAVGATFGGACGYAMGSQAAADGGAAAESPSADPAADEPLKPSGDVELDELRRLAVKAPIEELYEHHQVLLHFLSNRYRSDEILWRGVERLCDVMLSRNDLPHRAAYAKAVAQTIDLGEPGLQKVIGERLSRLRRIR